MSDAPHPMITRQATAVAIAGRAVLIEGPPGCGKSSLALALIDRGAVLIGDDGVLVERFETDDGAKHAGTELGGAWLFARPHPRTIGLIELRNVGLIQLPVAPPTRVALLLRLDPAAPRLPDGPTRFGIAGVAVPGVAMWPDSPVLALRAEHALRLHGLRFD